MQYLNFDNIELYDPIRKPPCWNRWTKLQRTLCVVAVTSLLKVSVIVITLVAFGYFNQKGIDPLQSNSLTSNIEGHISQSCSICSTLECIQAASEVLLDIDQTVDPCDDFYYFACGNWMNRHTIPEKKEIIDIISNLSDANQLKYRNLLEKNLTGTEPEFIKMTKRMYDSCMDLEFIEESGADSLKISLKLLGGWPVVEGPKWKEKNFDWIDTLKTIRELGLKHDMLLYMSVETDEMDHSVHTIMIDDIEPGYRTRKKFNLAKLLNNSSTASLLRDMVNCAIRLGANETTAKDELFKVQQFEYALKNFVMTYTERDNASLLYHKYTIEQLQKEVPQIPWLKYFNSLLNDEVYENDTLIVRVPEFFPKFADLIKSTEKRVLANYMLWKVVYTSAHLLSKVWRGGSGDYSRRDTCVRSVLHGGLNIALSSFYVRQYFSEEIKDAASELVEYIRRAFLDILEEIDWMGDQEKKYAMDKANSIKTFIGYPKELLNNTVMLEYYKNLEISRSYFDNIRRLRKWSKDNDFSLLRKPHSIEDWTHHAVLEKYIEVFHSHNAIEILASILQNPYFNKDRPQYMNFGGIGPFAGSLISFGFDDFGSQFDKDGKKISWWDKTTVELFKKRAQCFIDLFSNYTGDGWNINGVRSQSDNIAEFGGLKQAYWAYQSWVKDHGEEQLLPGLKFTPNQMFWISAARVKCEKYRPEQMKYEIVKYGICPEHFRTNGSMSLLPEFSKDFNCPPGSRMNRKERCQIW